MIGPRTNVPFFVCLLAASAGQTFAQSNTLPPKLKIFILAGQSNMEGKGSVLVLKHQLTQPDQRDRFAHLKQGEEWVEREDVWIDYLGGAGNRYGNLTVGYGVSKAGHRELFGPELGFGWTLGDHFDAPVLLIKTAWGGKSLDRDFRPPSRGLPDSAKEMYRRAAQRKPHLTWEEYQSTYGHFYRLMIEEIQRVTSDLTTYVPDYQDQGYELCGFIWFQGWNDQYAPTSIDDYQDNLAAFIRDVRAELAVPNLPFVIGAMGHHGQQQKGKIKLIADAQLAVAKLPEFSDSVRTVPTVPYWDTEAEEAYERYWADENQRDIGKWRAYGNDRPYHYLGSPVFFYSAGEGFAHAVIELLEVEEPAIK